MEHHWLTAAVVTSLDPSGILPGQWLTIVQALMPGHFCLVQNPSDGQYFHKFCVNLAETFSELHWDIRLFLSIYFPLSLYGYQTYLATWRFSLPVPALSSTFPFTGDLPINLLCAVFARTAKITYYTSGDLNNRNLFSRGSGAWRSKGQCISRSVSPRASLFALQMAAFFPLCPHMGFLLCAYILSLSFFL